MIKILLGGSPCTHWSIAQSKNRETTASGEGWELFLNYLTAKRRFIPDLFLYENNKSAAKTIKEQIAAELNAPLQYINSALVSAQNRWRFYAHNFGNVPQPKDRSILLQDILENGCAWKEKAYPLTTRCCGAISEDTLKRRRHTMIALSVDYKAHKDSDIVITENSMRCKRRDVKNSTIQGTHVTMPIGKTQVLSTSHIPMTFEAINQQNKAVEAKKIYSVKDGLISINETLYPINLSDGYYIIRKLTVTECCRLQTLPDDYCRAVSNTQAYKGLGNGWTAEIIIHLLSYALRGVQRTEPLIVLSMYDGIGTGRYCLERLGFSNVTYYSYEVDRYAMQVSASNYPDIIQCGNAFDVRKEDWFLQA